MMAKTGLAPPCAAQDKTGLGKYSSLSTLISLSGTIPMTSEDPSSPLAKLRHSLSLPLSSPPISHFLFSAKHTLFHPAPAPAPIFNCSISSTLAHTYRSLTANASGSVDMLFMPLGILHDIVIGYTITRASDGREGLLKGRFASALDGKYAVNVLHGISRDTSGIVSVHRREDVNVRRFFTVPNETYSFERLPNKVFAFIENVEYRGKRDQITSLLAPVSAQNDLLDMLLTPTPAAITGDPTTPSAPFTTHTQDGGHPFDWFDTRYRFPASIREDVDGELDVYRQGRATQVGAFDMTVLQMALNNLQESMHGEFYSPRICTDLFEVSSGMIEASSTGEMRARGVQTSLERMRGAVEMAAFVYFSTAMSIGDRSISPTSIREESQHSTDTSLQVGRDSYSTDEEVLNWVTADVSEQRTGTEKPSNVPSVFEEGAVLTTEAAVPVRDLEHMMQFEESLPIEDLPIVPVEEIFRPIAPAPLTGMVNEGVDEPALDPETVKQMKREAKKRYNRLSAAKSNAKKKERVQRQMRELEELKEQLPRLMETKDRLRRENEELKRRLAS